MAVDHITYQQLDAVLTDLGFTRRNFSARDRTWLYYEHAPSETEIVLVQKKPSEYVYQANVLSARRHLIENGLISEEELDKLLAADTKIRAQGAKN